VTLTVLALIVFQRVDREPTEVATGVDELSLSDAVVAGDLDLAEALLDGGLDPASHWCRVTHH